VEEIARNNGHSDQVDEHITSATVARLAGVGVGTVSRVIRGMPHVSPQMRERVMQVVKATNYRSCAAAGMLASQRYDTIGLIAEVEMENTCYWATLIQGILRALSSNEIRLAISTVSVNFTFPDLVKTPLLRRRSVDGLILDLHKFIGDIGANMAPFETPYVLVNPNRGRHFNSVMPDDISVASQAVEYLFAKGHRRIAYMTNQTTSPSTIPVHSSVQDRISGYLRAMSQLGGVSPLISECYGLSPADKQAMRCEKVKRLVKQDGFTAMLTYNSDVATEVFQVCYELGLRINQDVELMSCDYDWALDRLPVPITCMHLDRVEMGRMAVEMLFRRIANNGDNEPTILVKGKLKEPGIFSDTARQLHAAAVS